MKEGPNHFESWAVVELFGHAKEVGFVTTEYFGTAGLFRIDVPELPEREYVLQRPEYTTDVEGFEQRWTPVGAKVRRPPVPARSRLVGPGAIYSITPCTEETARVAIEDLIRRMPILLEPPKDRQQILLPGETAAPSEPQDRTFKCCGGDPESGHSVDCDGAFEEEDEEAAAASA